MTLSNKLQNGGKTSKKGGTFLGDVSVPAGLLLLNQFMKKRKNRKNKSKTSKKSLKRKTKSPKTLRRKTRSSKK